MSKLIIEEYNYQYLLLIDNDKYNLKNNLY